jgi:hypothetical protein
LIVRIESVDASGDGLGDGAADAAALALAVGDALTELLGFGEGDIVEAPVGEAVTVAVAIAVGVAVAGTWLGALPASEGVSTDEPPLQPAAAIAAATVAPTQSVRTKKLRSVEKRLTIHTYS